MKLNLTEEERDSLKITFTHNSFRVTYGKDNALFGKYFSKDAMLRDFAMNGIQKADFDDTAHYIYQQGDDYLAEQLKRHKFIHLYNIKKK